MAALNGKYRLVGGENVEAFYTAIKTSEEFKSKMRALAVELKNNPESYIEEIFIDAAAGIGHRTVYIKGEKKREGDAPLGKEYDGQTHDGRPVKILLKLESDSKMVRTEKAADFESVATFEVSGNELTVTQVCGGVKSVQKFARQ